MPDLIGKNVILRTEGKPRTFADLADLLRDLNVRDNLRFFGEVCSAITDQPGAIAHFDGIAIPNYVFAPLALELILVSDDSKTGQLDFPKCATLVDCFHNLPAAPVNDDSVIEHLIRTGQAELSFQRRDPLRLARTAKLFQEIWPKTPQAAGLDIHDATQTAFGVDLDATLLLGFAFSGRSKQGYVSAYASPDHSHPLARILAPEVQTRFLRALSTSYSQVRKMALGPDVSDELRRYRPNPLAMTPLVRPDAQPLATSPVFLVPCPKFLLDRVTYGLVYDLRKRFESKFDDAFGHAVENYVGDLLTSRFGSDSVKGEFRYSHPNGKRLSPDWTVFCNDAAIVLEVKSTLLHRQARTFGALEQVREDLERTFQKAVCQLHAFRSQQSRVTQYSYPSKVQTEYVVVTWDDSSCWANSILKDQIVGTPDNMHVHVVSVYELERILGLAATPREFYNLLWSKRCSSPPQPSMDMHDWLCRLPAGSDFAMLPTLIKTHEDFFSRWNLEPTLWGRCNSLHLTGEAPAS